MKHLRQVEVAALDTLEAAWVGLWSWCYPAGVEALGELQRTEREPRARLGFLLRLPWLARLLAYAELAHPTTDGTLEVRRDRAMRLRESMLATAVLGGLIVNGAIAASMLFTGNFVMDSAPAPGLDEVGSPYFHLVAGTILTSAALLVLEGSALAVLALRRRS